MTKSVPNKKWLINRFLRQNTCLNIVVGLINMKMFHIGLSPSLIIIEIRFLGMVDKNESQLLKRLVIETALFAAFEISKYLWHCTIPKVVENANTVSFDWPIDYSFFYNSISWGAICVSLKRTCLLLAEHSQNRISIIECITYLYGFYIAILRSLV